jgi:hypothetical protein
MRGSERAKDYGEDMGKSWNFGEILQRKNGILVVL